MPATAAFDVPRSIAGDKYEHSRLQIEHYSPIIKAILAAASEAKAEAMVLGSDGSISSRGKSTPGSANLDGIGCLPLKGHDAEQYAALRSVMKNKLK